MDRLEMARALLLEAMIEKALLEDYEKDYNALPSWGDGRDEYYIALEELRKKYPRLPKKSVVNDNIKMARRLLLDEYI